MKYILETGDRDLITTIRRTGAKLTRLDSGHFKSSQGKPLKAVQSFFNAFCTMTGDDNDRMYKDEFRKQFRAYLTSLGSEYGEKTDAQIGREAKKHCGLATKVVRHEGRVRRMYIGVIFRD